MNVMCQGENYLLPSAVRGMTMIKMIDGDCLLFIEINIDDCGEG